MKFSGFQLIKEGFRNQRGLRPLWLRTTEPKSKYDVVIVGAGGHGLATAYYLAKRGVQSIGVFDAGWLGGGNTARNTTVIRSNYLYPQSGALYELALRLYEGLGKELNFNVMVSQRGVLSLAHSRHELEVQRRWAGAIEMNGIVAQVPCLVEQTANGDYNTWIDSSVSGWWWQWWQSQPLGKAMTQ